MAMHTEGPKMPGTTERGISSSLESGQAHAHLAPPAQAPQQRSFLEHEHVEMLIRENAQPPMPAYRRRGRANPAPLGLLAFAVLWWVFGLISIHTRGIALMNGMIPVALGIGTAMVLGGIASFFVRNDWGATFMILYGMYWISWALYLIPFFNVVSLPINQFGNSMGCFYSAWFLLSLFFTMTCLRTSVIVLTMFGVLDLVYLLLMVAAFTTTSSPRLEKSAGAFSLVVSALAAYAGISALMTRAVGPFGLPTLEFSDKYD
ncbi:hypothetical protein V8E36_001157 [Tilletia maclaganii]